MMEVNEDYLVCSSPFYSSPEGLKFLKILNSNITFTELKELRTREFPKATDNSLRVEVSNDGKVVLVDWIY